MDLLNEIHQKRMGIVTLGWVDSGIRFTLWSTKQPKLDASGHIDIKGFKVRGNPIYNAFLTNYLGAQVINVNSPELYTALERGTVDITRLDPDRCHGSQLGSLSQVPHPVRLLLHRPSHSDEPAKWNALSAKSREILQKVAIDHESGSLKALQELWARNRPSSTSAGLKTCRSRLRRPSGSSTARRSASLARMKERMEKAGGMENYDQHGQALRDQLMQMGRPRCAGGPTSRLSPHS